MTAGPIYGLAWSQDCSLGGREIHMAELQRSNSFSWADALFLYVERPGQPLSMASVSVFEGPIPLKACRDFVESKLPLIPRYRQRVVFPPFNLGLPSWQFDADFDIRNHVRQVTLHNGTESDLKVIASEIVSTSLDRQRPLWDLTLVRGMEGNRTGMIARIHHCLADGIAGVELMSVLMGPTPETPPLPRKKHVFQPPPKRDAGAVLLDNLLNSYFSAVKGALTLHSEAMQIAHEALVNPTGPLADLVTVMPELATPAERLPFNKVCQGPQKVGWTEVPMAEIQAIRKQCGGTVNDVILTVVAATIRRYAELHGVRVKGRSVRMMIPVNVRGSGNVEELGNRISFLPVTLPLDVRDPQKLFATVRQRVEYLKGARAAEFVGFAGGLFATVPAAIWAALGPVASQLPLSLCNIICTNIPGPPVPLYLMGRRMLSFYPYVPIGGEMGFNCAILSYNGTAFFGFTCDVNALPDPENLEKFAKISFAELLKSSANVVPPAAEVKANPEPPKRKRPSPAIPVTAKHATKANVKGKSATKTKTVPPVVPGKQARKPAKGVSAVAKETRAELIPESHPVSPAPAPGAEREQEQVLELVGT